MSTQKLVSIVMGSDSDLDIMREAGKALDEFGISYDIDVPIPSTSLQGMDSLLATVQMPAGIPVATVAIGKPGAINAGILAAQMIGLSDTGVASKLVAHKVKLAKGVEEKSKKLKASQ